MSSTERKHAGAQERLTLGQDDGVAEVAAKHLDVVPVGRVEGGIGGRVGARQRHHRVAVVKRPGCAERCSGEGMQTHLCKVDQCCREDRHALGQQQRR